jgi:Uncharacterized protein conserved in bacteria (DUF2188)
LRVGKAIHVIAGGENDWLVREGGGREFGHYPTRKEAEAVGSKLARKRGVELVVHNSNGNTQRSRPRKGWFAQLFRW